MPRGGIVTDPSVHERVVRQLVEDARHASLTAVGVIRSPITGSDGNVEFLVLLEIGTGMDAIDEETIRAITSAA